MDTLGYSGPFYARTNRQMCRGGLRKVRQSSSFEQLEPRCILFCDVREARCRRLLAGCGFKGATDIDWCLERHRVAQVCVGDNRHVCGVTQPPPSCVPRLHDSHSVYLARLCLELQGRDDLVTLGQRRPLLPRLGGGPVELRTHRTEDLLAGGELDLERRAVLNTARKARLESPHRLVLDAGDVACWRPHDPKSVTERYHTRATGPVQQAGSITNQPRICSVHCISPTSTVY